MPKVYTMGYYGKGVSEIQRLALSLNAVVFDIRLSPTSRQPQFSGRNLSRVLGDRYRHVRSLGNLNYKGGRVQIADFEAGFHQIVESQQAVILLCVCKHAEKCHRTIIAQMLRERGIEVVEVDGSRCDPEVRAMQQLRMGL